MLLLAILYAHSQAEVSVDAAAFSSLHLTRHRKSSTSYHRNCQLSKLIINDAKSEEFWQQPSSELNTILSSPPPRVILDEIRKNPYKGGFEPVSDLTEPIVPKIIYGSIPYDLIGTLAINGPGRIRIGGRMLGHWFDGDGYITTLSFNGSENKVKAFGRFVRTARFKAQELKQQSEKRTSHKDPDFNPPLAFSGAWTKAGNGQFYENIVKIPQNPSNTAVMWLPPLKDSTKPRLFALCEGGHPIEVDPVTLEVVQDEQPFQSPPSTNRKDAVSSFFSAHYSVDPHDGTIYNHGYILDLVAPPSINLMKLSPDGCLLEQEKSDMPYNTFVHDSTISQSFVVYLVCPYITASGLDLIPFVFGKYPLGGLMDWKGGHFSDDLNRYKSYLHVHSKNDLKLKWRIEIPHPMSVYHISDAFEEVTVSKKIHLKVRVAELNSSNPQCDRPLLEKQFSNQYAVPVGTRLHSTLKEYTFALNNDGSGTGKLIDCRYIGDKSRDLIPCDYPATNKIGGDTRLQYTWVNTLVPPQLKHNATDRHSDWFDAVQKVHMENKEFSSDPISFGEGVVRFHHTSCLHLHNTYNFLIDISKTFLFMFIKSSTVARRCSSLKTNSTQGTKMHN